MRVVKARQPCSTSRSSLPFVPLPCSHELAYRDLAEQRDMVTRRVAEQTHELIDIYQSILQFYLTHSLCSRTTGEPVAEEEQPMPCSGSHAEASVDASSEMSRMHAALTAQLHTENQVEAALLAEVEAMERDVEVTVVQGVLAAQRSCVAQAERECAELEQTLQKQVERSTAYRREAEKEQLEVTRLREARRACEERIRAIAEKKARQMSRIDESRHELKVATDEADRAQLQLEQRRDVVRRLQSEIERHIRRQRSAKKSS